MPSAPRPFRRGAGMLARLSAVVVAALILSLGGLGVLSAQAVPLAPTVTSVGPPSGSLGGFTFVMITGTGFTGATAVKFGAADALMFTVDSSTSIVAKVPPGSAGSVDVTVTTPGGVSATSAVDQYTYLPQAVVTGINPHVGVEAGGTTVVITGLNFSPTTQVSFGSAGLAAFTIDSPTQITATSPPGTGDVFIGIANGGSISDAVPAGKFSYIPGTTVTGISPSVGPAAGGTLVTITGTQFNGAVEVDFGSVQASASVLSDTSITATAPAGTGAVDVRVIGPGGTSPTNAADVFTYSPTVTGVSPHTGDPAGGATITISGTGFTGATGVDFGGAPATAVIVVNATTITATSPSGTGTVDIRVIGPAGTSAISAGDAYSYVPLPTVTGVSPSSGPAAGGSSVDITGTGFDTTTAVTFGGTAAISYILETPTLITATYPAGTGTVDVRVTNAGGTSPTSVGDLFSYGPATLNLSSASVDVGSTITVSGNGFAPTASFDVVLHSTPVTLTTVTTTAAGAFSATITIPAGTAGGAHTIVVGGASIALTVVAPSAALASTGSDPSGSLGIAAGLLGFGLLLAVAGVLRRRSTVKSRP